MASEELWQLNLGTILKDKRLPAVVRLFILGLKEQPYVLVGDFLKELTDPDLKLLGTLVDDAGEKSESEQKQEYATFVLLTLSLCLATAEGVSTINSSESAIDTLKTLGTLITLESLHRKGLIYFNREAATFASSDEVLATVREP